MHLCSDCQEFKGGDSDPVADSAWGPREDEIDDDVHRDMGSRV